MGKTILMGILNVTPDSFYDGGKYKFVDQAIERARQMVCEGADIIDIGAESSRPGSESISSQEEVRRVLPVLKQLQKLSIRFSIDTSKPEVAKLAVDHGASMINDITGLISNEMIDLVQTSQVQACVMHMQNTPQKMQNNPSYPNGVVSDLLTFFERRIDLLQKKGIDLEKIILDPGIGFGKSIMDNLEILENIQTFKKIGCRILIGLSRKSFMGKILQKKSKDLLPATIAMNTIALMGGADMIRVHDVVEHRDLIDIISYRKTSF